MKKLVIVGGGFAGANITKSLQNKFNLILIDIKDYFEYTPGILRTIVEPSHLQKIQVPHKNYLKNAEIITGYIDEINKKYIRIGRKKINYDYLVICSGSNYTSPIKEQDSIPAARAESLTEAYEKLIKAKNILIVGGGLVGVELAAEICTHYNGKKIVLLHSREHLIQRNNQKSIKYVENFLKNKGVELILNDRLKNIENGFALTQNRKKIQADMIFMSTGIKPNFEFMKKNFSDNINEDNQIIVNDYLQIDNFRNIFAAGDITSIKEEKTAQNAEKQSEIVIKNLKALENGKKLVKYEVKKRAFIISLGKYNGVFEYKNFVFAGKIPALMKFLREKLVIWKYK